MAYHDSILTTVGRTPLVRLNRVAAGLPGRIALKGGNLRILWGE
jgi:cysteine synthase A